MTTEQGDTILDPFAGSGVTGAEAIRAGRKAYLIEKNEKVAEEVTKPRVENALKISEEVDLEKEQKQIQEDLKKITERLSGKKSI